jgi:hypothetical protein
LRKDEGTQSYPHRHENLDVEKVEVRPPERARTLGEGDAEAPHPRRPPPQQAAAPSLLRARRPCWWLFISSSFSFLFLHFHPVNFEGIKIGKK